MNLVGDDSMSRFDVMIKYVLLASVALLVAAVGGAIGVPWYVSALVSGVIGWYWFEIYSWIDVKMKEFVRRMM